MSMTTLHLRRTRPRPLHIVLTIVLTLLTSAVVSTGFSGRAFAGPTVVVSAGKVMTASSVEGPAFAPAKANDNDPTTRWSSAFRDNQWLQVDLGAPQAVNTVSISWEAAYARTFSLQGSDDLASWTDMTPVLTGSTGTQFVSARGTYRFIRLNLLTRATAYGFSVFQFSVQGPWLVSNCRTNVDGARNKPAMASSVQNASTPAAAAFDGDVLTRWSSAFSDHQWISVDLGEITPICRVQLIWERAYAATFHLEQSYDNATWVPVSGTLQGQQGVQTIPLGGEARFVRLVGDTRATPYGFSLFDMSVSLGTNVPVDCNQPGACPP